MEESVSRSDHVRIKQRQNEELSVSYFINFFLKKKSSKFEGPPEKVFNVI